MHFFGVLNILNLFYSHLKIGFWQKSVELPFSSRAVVFLGGWCPGFSGILGSSDQRSKSWSYIFSLPLSGNIVLS